MQALHGYVQSPVHVWSLTPLRRSISAPPFSRTSTTCSCPLAAATMSGLSFFPFWGRHIYLAHYTWFTNRTSYITVLYCYTTLYRLYQWVSQHVQARGSNKIYNVCVVAFCPLVASVSTPVPKNNNSFLAIYICYLQVSRSRTRGARPLTLNVPHHTCSHQHFLQ